MLYRKLDGIWKQACKIILGREIGELSEYKGWLGTAMDPLLGKESAVSKKGVQVGIPHYCPGAKFISLDEVDFNKRFEPLGIDEVKDIDSIVEGLSERFYYCGNVVLNNSKFVEGSSNISNSHYILDSDFIVDSKYAAYTSNARYAQNLFGVNNDVQSSFMIRGLDTQRNTRCMEVYGTYKCSDCYYTFGMEDCADVMFSLNLRSRRNAIGNLELSKEKYQSLKGKLLEELRGELEKKKSLDSLLDMLGDTEPARVRLEGAGEAEGDKSPMESSFRQVSRLVLGRELDNVDAYGKWLMEHNWFLKKWKSAVSENPTYQAGWMPYRMFPQKRLVTEAEAIELGKMLKLEEGEVGGLESIRKSLGKIGYLTCEKRLEEYKNLIDVALSYKSVNCYWGPVYSESENCAFCSWPRNSRNMFGCHMAFSSNSCMRTYNSVGLARCFEVDSSSNSSDLYFSHNCENVNDSMFCFNVKNMRNSIGNAVYSQPEYKSIKSNILEQVSEEIEKNKSFGWSVYNIGCGKKA